MPSQQIVSPSVSSATILSVPSSPCVSSTSCNSLNNETIGFQNSSVTTTSTTTVKQSPPLSTHKMMTVTNTTPHGLFDQSVIEKMKRGRASFQSPPPVLPRQ
jgi:hypothetical protein